MTRSYYGYKHWTLEDVPRCFNVGKGNLKRPFRSDNRNHKWHAIVKRYGLRVEVCVGPLTNKEACAWETQNIELMGTFSTNHSHDDPNDIGCNFTKGGDGLSGWHHSDATRKKMSESHAGVSLPKKTRNAISLAHKGRTKSTVHRQRLSESNLGKNTGKMAGERHHASKLSDATVVEIRQRWLTTSVTRSELRQAYDLNVSVLSGILTGRTFKHLLDDATARKLRAILR